MSFCLRRLCGGSRLTFLAGCSSGVNLITRIRLRPALATLGSCFWLARGFRSLLGLFHSIDFGFLLFRSSWFVRRTAKDLALCLIEKALFFRWLFSSGSVGLG